MTTKIVTGIIDAATLASFGSAGPTIANVQIANSSYSQIDDTALGLDGGYILINGNNFTSNVQVLIDGTTATSVTYVSSNQLQAQVGSDTSGSKVVYVINNNDGSTAIRVNGLTYSGTPTWVTDSTLAEGASGSAIAISLNATSDSSVTYSVATGSSLPSGLSLAANGYLTGTVTTSSDTTYNFSVVATDAENQDSTKAFSITITVGDSNINNVIGLMQLSKNNHELDLSDNAHILTGYGDVNPTSFSPYRGNYYSGHFDGTGDYLSISSPPSITTEDFTIEMWFYNLGSNAALISQGFGAAGGFLLWVQSTLRFRMYNGSAAQTSMESGSVVSGSSWHHIAVTRSSGTVRTFLDGVLDQTATFSDSLNSSANLEIGTYSSGTMLATGNISNLRMVVGTALYTSDFTPPTSPLTTTSQGATESEVKLLTCQSNRFVDNSTNNLTITINGDASISGHTPFAVPSSMSAYGSTYFDGTGDYYNVPNSLDFMFGSEDFTIESWVYPTAFGKGICNTWQTGGAWYHTVNSNGTIHFNMTIVSSGTTSDPKSSTDAIRLNEWSHVAVVKSGTSLYFFINGVADSGGAISYNHTNYYYNGGAKDLRIGIAGDLTSPWVGYISDLRILKGTGLYTSSFTPSTTPLSVITDTSILTLQGTYTKDNYTLVDKSGHNARITVSGDLNTSSLTPYSPAGWSYYTPGGSNQGAFQLIGNPYPFAEEANFGTTDAFTQELWVYLTGVNNTNQELIVHGIGGFALLIIDNTSSTSVKLQTARYGYSGITITGEVIDIGKWNHIVVTREANSGPLRTFINGTLEAYAANNSNSADLRSPLINGWDRTGSLSVKGYVHEYRLSKGVRSEYSTSETSVGTSVFSVPTEPKVVDASTLYLTANGPRPRLEGKAPQPQKLVNTGARIVPFSPYKPTVTVPKSYSLQMYYHDQVANVEAATFDMSGEFTLEAWVYPTNTPSQNWGIVDARASGGTSAYWIWYLKNVSSSLYVEMWAASGAGYVIRGSTAINLYEWTHVAITRNSSNVITVWVNGVSDGTATVSTNFTVSGSAARIGSTKDAADGSYESNGFISNLRIVTGSCLYTTGFTPSTTPLTAVSGTQLLTCQDSTMVDNSDNNYDISVTLDAQPSSYNPFGYDSTLTEYDPIIHGGSIYGDGTTDYADVPADAWNSLGQDDFCIQFWTYTKEIDANKGQIAVGGNKISIRFDSSNRMTFWVAGNGGPTSTPNNTVYPFTWIHVCLERYGSTNTLYINGVAEATNTTTPSNDSTPLIRIGGQYGDNTGYTFTGWLADLRIQAKAVYKGNFIPPNQVIYGDKTKIQLPFNDAAVYDSMNAIMFDTNTYKPSAARSKFNKTSLNFTPVNDYVYTEERHGTIKAYAENLKLFAKDFTIEFWWNFGTLSNRQDLLWIGTTGNRLGIIWNLSANQLTYYAYNTSGISGSPSFSINTWYHIAVSRSNGSTRMFVDGTQLGSTYSDSTIFDGTLLHLGSDSSSTGSYRANGYMDGLRITKGTARYTSNFTAPSALFKAK